MTMKKTILESVGRYMDYGVSVIIGITLIPLLDEKVLKNNSRYNMVLKKYTTLLWGILIVLGVSAACLMLYRSKNMGNVNYSTLLEASLNLVAFTLSTGLHRIRRENKNIG